MATTALSLTRLMVVGFLQMTTCQVGFVGEMLKGPPCCHRQGGLKLVANIDELTSRKMYGMAAPREAVAGDNRPAPVDPGRVGTEYPAVFP